MQGQSKINYEIIEFVRKTTEAITVISESTKEIKNTTAALKDSQIIHAGETRTGFETLNTKVDGLKLLFTYVIIPLIGGILALVGVKIFGDLPIK